MVSVRQLYELQELDTELHQQRERLKRVEEALTEPGRASAIAEELKGVREKLKQLQLDQRSWEVEAEALREKIQQYESKLYSGAVANVRELEGMRQEVDILRNHLKEKEDNLLELMMALEEAQGRERSLQDELVRAEDDLQDHQRELKLEQEALTSEIEDLLARRNKLASLIGTGELQTYESIRAQKGGVAVAKVERGMCRSCRVSLPTHQMQRARSGRDPVLCDSCGRILYVS